MIINKGAGSPDDQSTLPTITATNYGFSSFTKEYNFLAGAVAKKQTIISAASTYAFNQRISPIISSVHSVGDLKSTSSLSNDFNTARVLPRRFVEIDISSEMLRHKRGDMAGRFSTLSALLVTSLLLFSFVFTITPQPRIELGPRPRESAANHEVTYLEVFA